MSEQVKRAPTWAYKVVDGKVVNHLFADVADVPKGWSDSPGAAKAAAQKAPSKK